MTLWVSIASGGIFKEMPRSRNLEQSVSTTSMGSNRRMQQVFDSLLPITRFLGDGLLEVFLFIEC